jgi:two-component sensor histidine kinase
MSDSTHLGDDRGASLLRALANTGIVVICCRHDFSVVWSENVPRSWSQEPIEGLRFTRHFPADVAAQVARAKLAVLSTEVSQQFEISLPGETGDTWFQVWIDLERRPGEHNPQERRLVVTAVDVSEQKRREQTLRALLRELAHRSKNLLAIIQSIANQTGRFSGNVEEFLQRFRGRLHSLASSQDLVTSTEWRGADLRELTVGQVSRYTGTPLTNIILDVESIYLTPNAALHVGLALHELVVNSVSYGALSRPDGVVSLSSRRSEDDPDGALVLEWREAIALGDRQYGTKRFGSIALERVVPAALGGTAELDIGAERLVYTLRMPPSNFAPR